MKTVKLSKRAQEILDKAKNNGGTCEVEGQGDCISAVALEKKGYGKYTYKGKTDISKPSDSIPKYHHWAEFTLSSKI